MRKEDVLITVIVNVYNGERYVEECLDSVLGQTYQNLEILVVDDGSTDRSPAMIDAYEKKDCRVRAIHQKNQGVSAARNACLGLSNGDYICIVDQDDCLAPDYVEYLYSLIIENKAEISVTRTAKKFAGKARFDCDDTDTDKVQIWSGKEAARQMLYYNIIISPWSKMFSRDLIIRGQIRFHKNLYGGEGFCFAVACFQRANLVAVGRRKVYYYRVDNADSGMTKFSLGIITSSREAQKKIRADRIDQSDDMLLACKYANWHTHCDCLNMMIGCGVVSKYQELYREIKRVCRKDALCSLQAPISIKEKMKGICYFFSPALAARINNRFRLRKFTKEDLLNYQGNEEQK